MGYLEVCFVSLMDILNSLFKSLNLQILKILVIVSEKINNEEIMSFSSRTFMGSKIILFVETL